jgi:hypothetical protein
MAELLPSIETAANLYERTAAEIDALKSYEPKTKAERRRCATELVRLKQAQIDLAKQVIEENAAQQIAEVIGNDHSDARLNGSKGHAPTDQINWAQVIAETELRCERQIAALREQVADLVAKSAQSGEVVATSMSDDLIDAWAKGTVPFVRQCIADAVKPLSARLDEIEEVVRSLVKARARNDG